MELEHLVEVLHQDSGIQLVVVVNKYGHKEYSMGEYADVFDALASVMDLTEGYRAVVQCFEDRTSLLTEALDYLGAGGPDDLLMGQQIFPHSQTRIGHITFGKSDAYENNDEIYPLFSNEHKDVPSRTGTQNVYYVYFKLKVLENIGDDTWVWMDEEMTTPTIKLIPNVGIEVDDPTDGTGGPNY